MDNNINLTDVELLLVINCLKNCQRESIRDRLMADRLADRLLFERNRNGIRKLNCSEIPNSWQTAAAQL